MRLRRCAAALSLLTGLVAPLALAPASSAGQAPTVGWVTGVVLDRTGQPLRGMLVNALNPREVPELGILPDDSDRRTRTAADGSFRVRQSPRGYLVQVCVPHPEIRTICQETAAGVPHLLTYAGPGGVTDSWVTQTRLFPPTPEDRSVGALTPKAPSSVHGRVARAAGQELRVMRLNHTMAYRTEADADGDYRFRGLAAGRYYVEGGGNGWLPWRSPRFTVGEGADLEVNGALSRGSRIVGVLRSQGRAVPGTDVLLRRRGKGVVAATTTDALGRFRFTGLRPGIYRAGIFYDGSRYIRTGVRAEITDADQRVRVRVRARVGAVLTLALRGGGGSDGGGHDHGGAIQDELRYEGRPVQGFLNADGRVTYSGLRRGTYTIVAATDERYGLRRVQVRDLRRYELRPLRLGRPTITVTGRTAPRAVVEAMTGDQCPPDGPVAPGSFHEIERADAQGRYRLTGLVPGRYMFGADGWPHNYAPRCVSGVRVREDRIKNMPLQPGAEVTGRLVYAATGTPVITTLSYELFYPPLSARNPTDEHPARSQTRGATGRFAIDGLSAATVTGRLAREAGSEFTHPSYLVIFPFQDGTPYWLDTGPRTVTLEVGGSLDLGDIPVHLHR